MKRLRHQHSGKVLLLSVFSMVALIGIAGLAVDIGLLYSTRRQMQTAADAAAIAGANALCKPARARTTSWQLRMSRASTASLTAKVA